MGHTRYTLKTPKGRVVAGTGAGVLAFVVGAAAVLVVGATGAQAATAVGLGTADSFAVLAGSGITNTGATTITGDIGTFPTTTISGLGTITLNGTNHAGDAVTQSAKNDLVTAYGVAAGQAPDQTYASPGELGGLTLVSGVYRGTSELALTGTLTLDAAGDPNAVFVFQAGSTLITASSSTVALINGAQSCNVFWQVGSSATLGTGSTFRGNILALTSITANTSATVDGRLLASNGAVTMDTNTITRSVCNTPSTASDNSAAYAANVGPGAQGLVCPWGGVYNGAGLCVGTGANSLMNPSPSSSASATPSAAVTTPAASTPTASPVTPSSSPTPRPPTRPTASPSEQVPNKPSGGVGTGDNAGG